MASHDADHDAGFDVFISYSRVDIRLARVLHAALERYEVPFHVPHHSRRISVFRDETDIRGTRYYQSIETHIRSARKLLVICSPAARRSSFVADEIRRFLDARPPSDLIPVIASGRPNNEASSEELKAFPDLLGDLPLAADLTTYEPRRHRLQDREWDHAWHLILSNILDVERGAFEREVSARDEHARAEAIRLFEIADDRRSQGWPAEALLYLAAAHAIVPESALRASLAIATSALFPRIVMNRVLPLGNPLRGLRFSPDHSLAVAWSDDNEARLLDAASGDVLASHTHTDLIWNATFLRDGSAVTCSRDGGVAILRKGAEPDAWQAPFMVFRVIESPGGDLLALIGVHGEMHLWSRRRAGPVAVIPNFVGRSPSAVFSGEMLLATDGATLIQVDGTGQGYVMPLSAEFKVHQAIERLGSFLLTSADRIVLLFAAQSNEPALLPVAKRTPGVVAARLGPNVERLSWIDDVHVLHSRPWFVYAGDDDPSDEMDDGRVSVHIDPALRTLDFWNGDAVAVAYGDSAACAVSVTGELLWTRAFDRRTVLGGGVRIHAEAGILSQLDFKQSCVTYVDLADGEVIEARRAVRPIVGVESSSDGAFIAVAASESALRVASPRRRRADEARRRYYDVARVIDTGDRVLVAFAAKDGALQVLDAATGATAFPPLMDVPTASSLLITPDRRTATMLTPAGGLRAWRRHDSEAREIPIPWQPRAGVQRTSVSESGHRIAVASGASVFVLALDAGCDVLSRMVDAHDDAIGFLQLAPSAAYLASGAADTVRLWDPPTGNAIGEPLRFRAPVSGIGFTTGGRKLLAWSLDNSFMILDTRTGEAIRCVHPGPGSILDAGIRDVKISSDGRLLFTAGSDRALRIWDVETGDEVAEPAVHPFPLAGIGPSDNAERILTWGADVVSVWNPWSGSKVAPDIEVAGIVSSAFWTLDNNRVAVSEGTALNLFDTETSLRIAGPWRHGGRELAARFVDDVLITWTKDGLASVWELEAPESVADWRAPSERATGLMLDLDRRVLSPLTSPDHARLESEATRRALDSVYPGAGAARAVALSGFPSRRPLTEAAVRDYLRGERLFDLVLNPVGRTSSVQPFRGGSEAAKRGDGIVVQSAEGVMWQVAGADDLDFGQTAEYVRSMNAARLGGFDDWRLPRLHEAAATLSPERTGSLHAVPGLEAKESIWTSDSSDQGAIWIVHYGFGRILQAPAESAHAVRLVRTHLE